MKQVIQSYKTGKVTLEEVPVPKCGKKSILVRNCHSLISIGTERSTIELGQKSLLGKARARPDLVKRAIQKAKNEGLRKTITEAMGRLDMPTPLGYSAAGVVVETGIEAHGFSVGDRVACIGQGFASHADYISVPIHLATKLPDHVSTEAASFSMLGCIALHGVRCAELTFGSKVAVIGLGLLGQLTVQLLKAYGCDSFAYDLFDDKITLAKACSATVSSSDADILKKEILANTQNAGVDAVIIAAATTSSEPVDFAIELCRPKGKIIVVGVADIHPNRNELWLKEIELIVSKAAGPGSLNEPYEKHGIDYPIEIARWTENRNLQEFVRLLDRNLINPALLITHRFSIQDAETTYDSFLQNKLENPIGVLFEYLADTKIERHCMVNAPKKAFEAKNRVNVSVIGAGLYGKAVFLPVLKKAKQVALKTLVTSSGMSARHSAKRFGFESCSTDFNSIFHDDKTDALIALTPHSQHATLVLKALEHNKSLLIEKPLCINKNELIEIFAALNKKENQSVIMVGHNRRFSPHVKKMQSWLSDRVNPAVLSLRINAGYVPSDHWVHSDNEGRSRIVGEMTHFIDLMQALLNEKPICVFAQRVMGDDHTVVNNDNLVANFKFDGGSVASLVYTAVGHRAVSRESLEIFFDEKTIISTDFRDTRLVSGKKSARFKTSGQEMGYAEEIDAFIQAISSQHQISNLLSDTLLATQAVFAIEDSLATGQMKDIEALSLCEKNIFY